MGSVEKSEGPGPLPAVIGGVLAALALIWLVGVVIGTVVFVIRVAVFVGLVVAGFWVWSKITGD